MCIRNSNKKRKKFCKVWKTKRNIFGNSTQKSLETIYHLWNNTRNFQVILSSKFARDLGSFTHIFLYYIPHSFLGKHFVSTQFKGERTIERFPEFLQHLEPNWKKVFCDKDKSEDQHGAPIAIVFSISNERAISL